MALFLLEHHHRADNCPATNVEVARSLANHVSPANAAQFGVKVLSDCVFEGEHTLLVAVEADGAEKVATFAAPFMQFGPTTIRPVITCEIVAGRAQD